MSVLTSESVILKTWLVQEADLIVTFFTRDYGKVKGIAKSALRSRKRFGAALEPMTIARAWFKEQPRQEFVRLDQLEIIRSPLSVKIDYLHVAVMSFYAETLDELMPEHDPQDAVFRLVYAVLEESSVTQPWLGITYFSLWMIRLMGWLPDLTTCVFCGDRLTTDAPVGYHQHQDGFFCQKHPVIGSSLVSPDSFLLAQRILRQPIKSLTNEEWTRRRGIELRRYSIRALERHIEKRLKTIEALKHFGG